MGDAHCSLNPIHGQGMTVAALQAVTLRECLQRGTTDLARRFFTGSAQTIGNVWARNQPRNGGPRSALSGRHVRACAAERLLRVAYLIDPPARLDDPKLLPRVAAANARQHYSRFGTARRPQLGRSSNTVMPA
jgi:hypothetical protein